MSTQKVNDDEEVGFYGGLMKRPDEDKMDLSLAAAHQKLVALIRSELMEINDPNTQPFNFNTFDSCYPSFLTCTTMHG